MAEYHTDARLLQYSIADNGELMLAAAETTHALSLGDGVLSLTADALVADVHVAVRGDRVELWSSRPVSRLDVQGEAIRHVRTMRLNGRDVPIDDSRRVDTVAVGSSDWADPEPEPNVKHEVRA
jgi:hypothetical protein